MTRTGGYEEIFMSVKNGYTQINNTLLWALMQLPKSERITFTCLRIESDYRTHETNALKVKDIVEFTGLKRQSVDIALRSLEKKRWIVKIDKNGYRYQWDLSIARLTNAEVYEFLQTSTETDSQREIEFAPQLEAPPVDRFQVEEIDGKSVKVLNFGPRVYRYNNSIADFETKAAWKEDAVWETANGQAQLLSEADKTELRSHAF